MEQKRGIDISIIILGDFNTSQKLMEKVDRQIDKNVGEGLPWWRSG